MIAFAVFAIEVVYGLYVIKSASSFYRGQGMSMAKAQEEGIAIAAKSKVGQEFAMSAARNAVGVNN